MYGAGQLRTRGTLKVSPHELLCGMRDLVAQRQRLYVKGILFEQFVCLRPTFGKGSHSDPGPKFETVPRLIPELDVSLTYIGPRHSRLLPSPVHPVWQSIICPASEQSGPIVS